MDSNIVPKNQLPDFMSIPPHMLLQYNQPEKQNQALQLFWQQQLFEISKTEEFKNQKNLPLARIKKVMKSDQDVKKITGETAILMAKACELFIKELTLRSWMQTEECTRRIMKSRDIDLAIHKVDCFDFLHQLLNFEEHHHYKEKDAGNSTEANPPSTAGFIRPSVMNMDTAELAARDQQFAQPYMIQPTFTPSAPQFPQRYMMPPPFTQSAYFPQP